MSRPLRIEFPGAYYHVMNKGDRGNSIFLDDIDKRIYISLLASAVGMFRVKVFAFSLMDTHFHLLISTIEANLSRIMHYLTAVYTQKFNHKNRSEGHVFRGRYKAILVDRDSYFLEVCRYIHTNPVRAGIVKSPEDHLWTSHRLYTGASRPPSWMCTDEPLAFFGEKAGRSRQMFDAFIKKGVPSQIMEVYDKKRLPAVLGSETFVKKYKLITSRR